MAVESQTQASVEGGGEATPAKAGGFSSYLPLIIAVVLMPVAAWVTLEIKGRMDKKSAGQAEETPTASKEAEAGGHGDDKKDKGFLNRASKQVISLPIPLTKELVKFMPGEFEKDVPDRIVTMDVKGEVKDIAHAEKLVVNPANTGGTRYVAAAFWLVGEHPELIGRINRKRIDLIDTAKGALSSKTLEDLDKPGFRNLLRAELLQLFNQILGPGSIREVKIDDFVIQ